MLAICPHPLISLASATEKLLLADGVTLCLQFNVSHACDITAAQRFASGQGLGFQSVTMPTTPFPVGTHHSPTFLKASVPSMAES